ncbi:MAG: sensor histidine kinase [Anaerolineaceae bacterium]|nr:sensor histidine kinase [Anaerolineaceae bacterium]
MARRRNLRITLGSGSRLAFAIVVLASYFAMFSQVQKITSLLDITLIMLLGTAYIAIGVYGYDYCAHSDSLTPRLAYFSLQIPLGALIVYLSRGAGFNALILIPLVGHAVVFLDPVYERITNLAVILAYILSTFLYSHDWNAVLGGLPIFLAGAVFIMVFTQMALNEENARTHVELLVDELEQVNQRLRGYAVQAEELAITRERNRLAREIHDGLGHYLTAIYMQIQAARALMRSPIPLVDETLFKAQNLAQDALVDVRQSVAALRASPGQEQPLPEVLERMPGDSLDSRITSRFSLLGKPRPLTPQAHLTLYRAAQEGLNNTRKHAHASHVNIVLDYSDPSHVRLEIQDNGAGSDNLEGGFGLLGIQERAHLLGGEVVLQSAKGEGFCLEVVLPG